MAAARLYAYLSYDDAPGALRWLEAVGCDVVRRQDGANGEVLLSISTGSVCSTISTTTAFPRHVFHRLAARDVGRASAVFRTLLRRPGFDWDRDGATLLRERKESYFARPARPSTSVIGERLVPYVGSTSPSAR